MKKFYYHLAVCLCVIGGLVGCSKEDEPGGGEGAMYQVTVVQVRPHLEALEHLAIPYRALHLAFVHHIVKLHIQVIAADILCPANGSQTQQAAYKKHLLHNIMDLLVWKSVFSRANRNGLKR